MTAVMVLSKTADCAGSVYTAGPGLRFVRKFPDSPDKPENHVQSAALVSRGYFHALSMVFQYSSPRYAVQLFFQAFHQIV